ncbi:TetR-like C-terminal domain-containing protein [Arthrobacter sp. UCD-GKA]|uniref:TetR-like C-terminal domain-containing protein n=1 Tax=Arthrobacter sp. UCD-GKA TaxID=1913576 RepID=UPI00158723AE|nr:TetR-like C-terminal domain-containing protein [Arthrobacter sp. UCD-GKA]
MGRPRDTEIADRVLRAAVDLLREKPVGDDFTLAELVARSGASRAAIYRRWENRQAVVVAALDAERRAVTHIERDSVLESLVATYDHVLADIESLAGGQRLIDQRLALGLRDKALQQAYWERHVSRRRASSLAILKRGKETGEIRVDVDLEVVLDLINGATYYQTVVRPDGGTEASRARVREAIRMLFCGIAA